MYLIIGRYPKFSKEIEPFAERYRLVDNLLVQLPLKDTYNIIDAGKSNFDNYRLVHSEDYVKILETINNSGKSLLGITPEIVAFEKIGVAGTLTATSAAIENCSTAYHLGGGYHHGMPDKPNSIDYCNDVAIALSFILKAGFERILYVDLDCHHPNGVQCIFERDSRIIQISLHQSSADMFGHFSSIGKGAGMGTKINMPLPAFTGDQTYLNILNTILSSVMRQYQPQVVFYQAGVDPHHSDPFGQLSLSLTGLYKRDFLVKSLCAKEGVPFIVVLGGGYSLGVSPYAIINTLAALANKDIIYSERETQGANTTKKAQKWLSRLRSHMSAYFKID